MSYKNYFGKLEMPYHIQHYKNGYRVYSISGTPLSKKPLDYETALRQLRAVYASEGRRIGGCGCCGGGANCVCDHGKKKRGGSKGLGNADYALSDSDIQQLLGGTKLFTYPELHNVTNIDQVFDKLGRCIMLYLTEDKNTGHWVCMIKRGKTVEYFDPYGGYGPDDESKWLSPERLRQLGQDKPILSALLADSGYKVKVNPYKFQKGERGGGNINTCGRHCVVRLLLSHLPLKQYAELIKGSGVAPDDFVTTFTASLLGK